MFRLHVYCSLKYGIEGYWNLRVKFWHSTKDSSTKQKMLQDFILTLVHVFWDLSIWMQVGPPIGAAAQWVHTENVADQEFSVVASTSVSLYMCVFRLPSEGEARHTAVESADCAKLRQQVSHQWVHCAASWFTPSTFSNGENMWQGWHLRQSWNGITIDRKKTILLMLPV